MSNQVLYRKYRPQKFDEVLGQEHIIKVLKGALKLGNISHAYLFSGSRGTGKTSVARIVARELGCSDNDIHEIDAASNRGIDDVRALREAVRSLPFDSKYKIYIIDEVHMLTKEAFNALLKTLEEPPPHVVFILATTELEKVPETIISRCQTFVFKKPTEAILKSFTEEIAKKEGFGLEGEGAELIAILGDGSFRDTHGILEKIFSFSRDKKISLKEIEEVTSAPSRTLVHSFIQALADGSLENGLVSIEKVNKNNLDAKIFLKLVLYKLRMVFLLRYSDGAKADIQEKVGKEELDFLTDLSKNKSQYLSANTLSLFLGAYQEMRYAFIPELPLELALIKILSKD